jgi:hypothetical protein
MLSLRKDRLGRRKDQFGIEIAIQRRRMRFPALDKKNKIVREQMVIV